jgi:hypothetical protein
MIRYYVIEVYAGVLVDLPSFQHVISFTPILECN